MHIKNLHCMIEDLISCAKHEVDNGIASLDTKEMGEVADIIKDLCEAEYYAKISKAMDESEYGEDYDLDGPMDDKRYYRGQPRDSMGRYKKRGYEMTPEMYRQHDPEYWRDMDREHGKMYYSGVGSGSSGGSSRGSMSGGSMGGGSRNYGGESGRDYREGRSGERRRSYMETKEMNKGNSPEEKQRKMKELETYAKELAEDVTEMISDASSEEKSMLKAKLQTLVQKIQ